MYELDTWGSLVVALIKSVTPDGVSGLERFTLIGENTLGWQ